MPVEASGLIGDLNRNWPLDGDEVREGSQHLRLLKDTLLDSLPGITTVPVTATDVEMNYLVGVTSAIQTQLDALSAAIAALDLDDVGDIKMSARASLGSNWLECNGAAVDRTTYAALFAVIGETFGAGDGSTTFNVPDYTDAFPRGVGSSPLGGTGGADEHTIQAAEIPNLSFNQGQQNFVGSFDTAPQFRHNGTASTVTVNKTASASSPIPTLPKYLASRWWIRAL